MGKIKLGMLICHPSIRTIIISVCGRFQTGRQNRRRRNDLENSHERIWENQPHFLTTKIWDALKECITSVMKLWQTTGICSNPGPLQEQ